MHPTGPYGRAGTHTRCHCGGPSGGSPVLSVRSHHTTMQRARSRGGWTMSQARPRQHADGRLVSTRSCWCTLARVATAAARVASKALLLHSGGAAAGVARHNPIPVRPPVGWRGAAMRATAAAQHAASGAQGSQGVCRNSHLAASGGRVDELPCHCGGTAAPLRRRRSPKCDPPAPPAAAFPPPSAGAKRARPLPPSPSLRWSAPSQRGGRGPCAGQGYLPCKAITHVSCRRGPSSSCQSRSSC